MTETNGRADVTFPSAGARCAGWLYRPANADGEVPCVVMAHGLLTRHDNLSLYAEALARAGAAVLVYDHRYLGDSEGEPRQRFRMPEHLDDRLAAIAFARTLDGIDPDRIIVWGFSISAGSAIEAAVADERVAGAILLCPFADARWRLNREARVHPRNAVWLMGRAIRDAMIPVAGEPGDHGALTFPGELDGFHSIVAPGWRNEMRSGVAFALWFYRPSSTRESSGARCSFRLVSATSRCRPGPSTSSRNGRRAPCWNATTSITGSRSTATVQRRSLPTRWTGSRGPMTANRD